MTEENTKNVMPLDEFESLHYDRESKIMTLSDFNKLHEVNVTPRTVREKSLFESFREGTSLSLGGTPSNIGKAMVYMGETIREGSDRTIFGTKPIIDTKPLGDRIYQLGMRIYAENETALAKRKEKFGETDTAGQIARDIGSGAVSLASALGLSLVSGPATAGIAFGASAGLEGYIESRKKGKDYEESVRIGQLLGFVEGSLEFVGIDRLIKSSGGIIKRAMKGYITEFLQETSQSLSGNAIRVASGLREFNNKEDLINIMSEAGYEGAIGGVLGSTASVPISIIQRQSIEDGFKAMGVKPKRAEQIADSVFKRGLDDVMSATEALELGVSQEVKEGLLASEEGKLKLPELPFLQEEKREELYQNTVNRFQSIENTVERAKSLGAKILPGEDAGISSDRYLSIANQAENVLNNGTFLINEEGNIEVTGEGLRPILRDYDENSTEQDVGARENDLDEYLIAKRTIEDLQRPSEQGGKNIATDEQVKNSQKVIDKLNKKYGDRITLLEETSQRIYDYQKRVLLSLVESGNISQEQYDGILSLNKNYVPFDRVVPEEEFSGLPLNRKRFSGAKSPIKKIEGSELEIQNPIESIIKNTHVILDRSSRNKVFSDIYLLKDIEGLGIDEVTNQGKGIINGYINGEIKHLKVSKNLSESMTGLTEVSSNWIASILSIPTRTLRIGATITPEFIVRNPLRDQWTALIQTDVGFKPFIDSIGSFADILGESEIYNDWIRSGGSYAGFVELSRPQLGRMVDKLRDKKNIPLNIIMTPANISQLMEQATRLGVFKASLRTGKTMVEAARESRESTLNFARRGSQTKEINAMIAFFNAGIQGFDKMTRTMAKDPAGTTLKALSTITVPSLLLYLVNRDDPEYFELPRWQRDLFWVFKFGNTWVRIPKPFAFGQIFGSLPERFFEFLDTRKPESFNKLNESVLNVLSPFGEDPLSTIIPTALKPLIENQANWSFFRKRPIVPQSRQRLIPSEQYSKYDTGTSKALGKIFGISPSKIENLVQGWAGGSGRYALSFSDYVLGFKRGELRKPKELSDVPLIKGFVARSPIGGQSQSVNQFYTKKREIDTLYNTFNKFRKEDKEKAKNLKEKNPQLSLSPKLRKFSTKIRSIDKRIEKIISEKDMNENEKRQAIRDLEESKTALAREANDLIENN